jgi:hypothetical protein
MTFKTRPSVQLYQAPDPGAVGAEVGLDVGGRLAGGGQVDAEQLGAPLQRRRIRGAAGPRSKPLLLDRVQPNSAAFTSTLWRQASGA